jgi:putative ABC transport system permease protein
MLKNYLSITLRNIRQNPLYAFINIFSLSIGLAACIVIYLFIKDERGFDAFHSKSERIYRLDEVQNFTGTNLQKVALSMPGMGPHLRHDFPEVKEYTRFWRHSDRLVKKDDKQLIIESLTAVDSTFLDIFDFKLLAGDRATALDEPSSVLLTRETAAKFFPSPESAVGSTITIVDDEFKITGILENVPENSHLQFDGLISLNTFTRKDPGFNDRWGGNFLNTYLVLEPGTDIAKLESKMPDFMLRFTGDKDINKFYTLFLQRLDLVHLASMDIEHDYNNYRKFNGKYLDIFFLVGVFILLIASVNFMNLTTARASHRWKEIGVRKTIGAKKIQLFGQFIFESSVMSCVALIMALILAVAFVPMLNELIGRELSIYSLLYNPYDVLLVVVVALSLGLLTGIYPSVYMTSFDLSKIFKGGNSRNKSVFRSGLVVVQFGLALAMIVSTLIVLQQLSFMKNKDIGFSKDQMLLVSMNDQANEKYKTIKEELLRDSHILGVTASGQRLGNNFHQWGFKVKTDTAVVDITPSNVNVDFDYLKVYGIKLRDGRDFSDRIATDNGMAFIINESFAKELGIKEVVGTPAGHGWYHNDSLGSIIGVAQDFNFNSLHYKVNTLSMVVHPDWGYSELSIKVDGGNVEAAIAAAKNVWDKNITGYPFSFSFLDDHFATLYRSDEQMSAVVSIMASLAILISCMGLFGLAAITTERKTKEIGIRKVLGASETQITVMLSRNFALLIGLSFLITSPATYWLLSVWLENFAYRVDINPLIFVFGGMIALTIALVTISYHTLRYARANPVKALRYE